MIHDLSVYVILGLFTIIVLVWHMIHMISSGNHVVFEKDPNEKLNEIEKGVKDELDSKPLNERIDQLNKLYGEGRTSDELKKK